MRRVFIALAVIGAILIGVFLPVRIPCTITTPCRLLPNREWLLIRDMAGGTISSFLVDHRSTASDRHATAEPLRGDTFTLSMNTAFAPGDRVAAGDTIAVIDSFEAERELFALRREREVQQALLQVAETGEKQALIDAARQRLAHARELLDEQKRITARLDELQAAGFAPYQEYEIARSTEELYRIGIMIAEAEVQSLTTGAKPEEVDLIRATIESYDHEIGAIEAKLDAYTITAPLTGLLLQTPAPDTLAWIADTSSFIAFIPLRLGIESQVSTGQEVRLTLPGSGSELTGSIEFIGNAALNAMSEQVVIATARFIPDGVSPRIGSVVECEIICPPIIIRSYLSRIIRNLFS